jgi:RIO-like serine/threonine protein kinase
MLKQFPQVKAIKASGNHKKPFTREQFNNCEPELIHKSFRWGNADIYRFCKDGECWVVKDFKPRSFFVRHTYGAWMTGVELSALRLLSGLKGFPQEPFRLDRFAFAYRFTLGKGIGSHSAVSSPAFFEELEQLVEKMHERGVAHLDIRAAKNILITDQGEPFILDFQSYAPLKRLPCFLRNLLVNIDRSAVYKHWERKFPDTLGHDRAMLLDRMNWQRRFWIFKGYFGIKKNK